MHKTPNRIHQVLHLYLSDITRERNQPKPENGRATFEARSE